MPRYFLHLYNDMTVPDEEGVEQPDQVAAEALALCSIRDMAAVGARAGRIDLDHRIDLADEAGDVVRSITMREAVEIVG